MSAITATTKLPLNHYLTEVPEKNASTLRCKAFALNVLEKICWVAIIAIMAAVLAISYSGMVMTGTMSLAVVGMALSTIFFAAGLSKFRLKADQFAKLAEEQSQIAAKLKEIAHWKTLEIQQFMRDHGLNPDQVPLDALRQINQEEPLCALLPLIARFKYLKQCAEENEKAYQNSLAARLKTTEDSPDARASRKYLGEWGWYHHEHLAIPNALSAAVMLQIIQLPTRELTLPNLGEQRAKDIGERALDQRFEPINDDCFVFHEGLHRASLSLEEVEQTRLDPPALRLKLFPTA